MKELLARLVELQKIEAEAEKIRSGQKNLPTRLSELEAGFSVFCESMEQKRQEFEDRQKQKKEKDRQLQTGQEALKRTRERLSEVKTNKEYQSMLKEIATSEVKNGKLEDEIIALLDGLEVFQKEMKASDEELALRRSSYEGERQAIQAELDSLNGKLEECLGRAGKLKEKMPDVILKKYERIKVIRNGLAVVAAWKEICYGCHMAIPPQMYNELQTSEELITCPNCNRILYWEDRNSGSN
ncbi:MAG: C4-type zinc ribbon domain-containing protein [Syntrophales bacterium]|nr:C4-type zinc ribbon domain-containing protein [Syntrophales bacterium]